MAQIWEFAGKFSTKLTPKCATKGAPLVGTKYPLFGQFWPILAEIRLFFNEKPSYKAVLAIMTVAAQKGNKWGSNWAKSLFNRGSSRLVPQKRQKNATY